MSKNRVKRIEERYTSDSVKQDALLHIQDSLLHIMNDVFTRTKYYEVTEMCEIGELLFRGKLIIDHGKFKMWVNDCFEFSYRTAKNFMSIYKMALYYQQEAEKDCECGEKH